MDRAVQVRELVQCYASLWDDSGSPADVLEQWHAFLHRLADQTVGYACLPWYDTASLSQWASAEMTRARELLGLPLTPTEPD